MNKIYKVIWNRVRHCYVVVSELAHSQGKTKCEKKSLSCSLVAAAAVLLLTGGGQFLTVQAADTQINDSKYYTNGSDLHTDTSTTTNQNVKTSHYAIAVGENTVATGTDAIAAGTHNTASGNSSIAFGGTYLQQTVRKHGANCKVYQIGDKTYYLYGKQYFSTEDDKQFTGDTSTATAVMVNGGNTASGVASVAFGQNTQATSLGSVAFGMGTQAGDGNGGQNSVAFGNYTKALGGRSVAFGENTIANYNDSVAFGNDTRALSTGATAFGNRTRALAKYSTAWGNATVAADEESTAWGRDTIAGAKLDENGAVTNNYKINPKDKNESVKQEQMDVHGNLAYIQPNGKTAGIKQMQIDSGSELHDYVVLDGQDGNTYVRDYQGSLWKVKVDANGKVTVDTSKESEDKAPKDKVYNGQTRTSLAKTIINNQEVDITPDSVLKKAHEGTNGYDIEGYKDATAFGYSTEASGDYATAFGNDTKAKASAATAFGTTTIASGDNATAFGLGSTASGKQATAFGSSSTASGDNATAFGENSTASGEAATAFGIGSNASGKNSLAALGGTASNENSIALGKDTKADNADGAVSVAIGQNAEASGAQSLAIGFGNISETNQSGNTKYPVSATQAAAKGAIAIGINTGAIGEHSIAMGSYTDAAKDSSVAIGFDTHTVSDSAVAIGSGTKAAGRYSVALGLSSIAGTETNDEKNPLDGGGSVAMGYAASAEASRSIAIGTGATAADSQFTTAVGDSTTAQAEGSVAIGAGSIATRGAGNKESTASTDVNTGKTTITYGDEKKAYLKPDNLSTDKASTWVSTTGAVSVGGQATYKEYDDTGKLVKKTKLLTRQITNVAAGSDDTDAVNVAQLKAAQPTVTSNDHSVTINTTTDSTDYHKIYDLKIATATLSQEKTKGDKPVETGKVTVTNPTYKGSDGKDVTNENAYVTGNSVADAINKSGFNLTASASEGTVTGNKETLIHPGDTVTIDAGKNISLTQENGKISIATKDKLVLGKDTSDGKDGQEGTIGLTGKDGLPGADGKQGYITTIIKTEKGQPGANGQNGKPGVDGTDITRIVYQNGKDGEASTTTHTVATLDDGQKYAGDVQDSNAKANAFSRKLNEQTNVVGGVTNLNNLSKGNNVGVVSNGTDTLTIRLAKKLTDLTSVTTVTTDAKGTKTSETVQDGNGITITPSTLGAGKSAISLTDNGLSNGGNQITHVDSGLKDAAGNKVELKDATGDILNNAVNVGDLQKVQNVASAHTAVTVNGSVEAPDAGANGTLGNYTDEKKGNLLLAQKKDTTTGQITYDLKLNDKVILGKDGTDGQEGTLGLTGKDGLPGADGKQGYSTTIIKTEKGQPGADGKNGKPGVDGTDITRIVYTDKDGNNPQTVATLSDGLKFAGDDISNAVNKKLNETLQIRGDGTYDKTTQKTKEDGNIRVSADTDTGTIKVALNKDINLKQNGSLTVGGDTQDGSATGQDPIVIKHFDDKTLDVITGVDKEGKPIIAKEGKAGDYVTGLDNKNWDVTNPTYVSGRAATEDQLKTISDAVNKAASTAGMHTVVTVNDKDSSETTATVGTDGKYGDYSDPSKGNLLIASKDENGKTTYNIKLNDQLTIGQKGEPGVAGKDGKDGKVTVETKGGTTVVIGHDGKDGDNGKDGLFVTGKDGKDGKSGVSITGPNGADGADGVDGKVGIAGKDGKEAVSIAGKDGVGHIGLTGPKGEKGADGTPGRDGISIDITTDLKTATLDDGKNVKTFIKDKDGKETTIIQAPRIQYESNGKNYEVATMDDGLKFVGNDGKEVTKKLNSTLSLTGGMDKDAVAKASSKNLGVRSNEKGDGLEIVMTDTPDFTKVTVGEGTDPNSKITIGKQTVTGKKSDGTDGTSETGKYITGLDNTKWNKDNVVENRAATEGQLRDIAGSITNQQLGGGFALTSDEKGADKIVKQDLGKAIQIKGDTTYKADGTVEKAGNIKTSIDNGAIKVELNKDVDLTKEGSIKAGETTINKGGVDTNKITIKDSTISISKDGINGGGKQITNVASGIDGKTYDTTKDGQQNWNHAASIGDVKTIAGKIEQNVTNVTENVNQIGKHVDNIQKDVTQLQQDVKADRTYQGDDGAAKKVKVKFGSFLSLTGGAKLADLTEEGNIGVVQKEIDDPDNKDKKIAGLSVRLAKHLNLEKTTYTSNENGQTYTSEIDGKGLTIKTGDENRNITVQDGNVNMGGNQIHNVAPGQAPGDAVNVSQLNATNQTVANLGGAVNKLGTRVNRVGAGAAALAALHPLDFDPDDKWDFAAGYGNYKDASAVAVGAYYRPNEDTMFSVGGSFGGGENMVNAGVSFKVGQGNHVSTSRVAMAKEIKDLRQDVANLNAIVNRQSALIDKLTGTNAGTIQDAGNDLFPDVPANHWAYEYVTKLKQAGILTGYPDGNFDGDRMMTRYEFAAIVYRAIMAGAASNPALSQDGTLDKLAKEFSPEMKHIRIDTIAKDKNGKPTIERVRVIPEAQQ